MESVATDKRKGTNNTQIMSTLMFWNKQNGNSNQSTENGGKGGKKTWLHAPDTLLNGHVAYLVKVSRSIIIFFSSFFFYLPNQPNQSYISKWIEIDVETCAFRGPKDTPRGV